jgi:TonB family protein
LEAVVDVSGRLTDISVVSPLGFGLDERAREAVEKWRFEPGRKNGNPVSVLATIEVNFRFQGRSYDAKAEELRTRFNSALNELNQPAGSVRRGKAIESIQKLANQNFAPAQYVLGKLVATGDSVDRDPERGAALIRKAADANYGPAIYDLGLQYYQGDQVPKDTEKGLGMLRKSATLGSAQAQFLLGNLYARGTGVPQDPVRARSYLRLCAASGQAECQLQLAKLILDNPQEPEREYVQAVAWLEMAAAQKQPEAQRLLALHLAQLTPEQAGRVDRFKRQLVTRQ